jgi:hypothetical protein
MGQVRQLAAILRAASWTVRSDRVARRQLRTGGLDALRIEPPQIPYEGKAGVRIALKLWPRNCVADAAVRQAWCAAQGRAYDLVIGVKPPGTGFGASAWLSGDPRLPDGYVEIARLPPPFTVRRDGL